MSIGSDAKDARYPDWIDSKKGEIYIAAFAQARDFDDNMASGINAPSLAGLRQYTGRGIPSLHSAGLNGIDSSAQLGVSSGALKVNFNVTASIIDTLTAKLASIKAVPQAVTFKGNSKGRQLADDLNFLLKGIFHKYNLSHMLNLAFRDAMINRVGYLKVIKEEGGICIDKVYSDEIIIDTADGYYNNPYKMLHRKPVPIKVMLEKYPQFEKEIRDSQIQEVRQYNTRTYTPHVNVIEGWCKNTYTPGGRHFISIEKADLLDESWDKDYFPIIKCEYNEPALGWMGASVVDELHPLQSEADRIMIVMQAIMKIMSVPRVFIDSNANVNKNHITNKVGLILEYDGKQGVAPIIHNGAAMPPELMQQLEFIIQQCYARVGLTPMDTQGQQPVGSGNTSGEALKTMTDIKSERWELLQTNYEQKHVELAQVILNELKGEKIKITAMDRVIGLKEISTKVIPKTEGSYVLKIFPVSSMPKSIPDLMDSVERMVNLGLIPKSKMYDLFNIPDLDAEVAMLSAPMRLIDKKLDEMMDTGKYWQPEPYYDLDYAAQAAIQHYNWAELHDEPEDKLKLLRRFIKDVQALIAQCIPPAPVQPVAAPQQPTQGVQQ